ncbi:MAG: toll/interleukin-1 receptor domain-containing protein [Cytophagaceae bacterium]|nr:toll/interleukin-1 receptor domain-containing protein [Cytophagaceae bacterium]
MKPNEVFLSHSSLDRSSASRLASELVRHGIRVWYSKTSIKGAQQWHDEIGQALKRCDWFIILLSPHSIDDKAIWVKRELMYALRQYRFKNRIVPVILEPCDVEALSWVLPDLQLVDFSLSFEDGCREILGLWEIPLKPLSDPGK